MVLRNCRALLHYYFAAAGNSSFAQLALGYRHAHGLGVPKSCQSSVGACRHAGRMCAALIGRAVQDFWWCAGRELCIDHSSLGNRLLCLQVLYYNPVAEQVVELARLPNTLPQARTFSRTNNRRCEVSCDRPLPELAFALQCGGAECCSVPPCRCRGSG